MNRNEEVIKSFYSAFQAGDWQTMQSCYHDDIIFQDPAFGKLYGEEVRKMWKVLNETGNGIKVSYYIEKLNRNSAEVHWKAWYTFAPTGRHVRNKVISNLVMDDGLIVRHTDSFDLHRWAKQALGFKGFLFGGTKFFQAKLQEKAVRSLRYTN